MNDNPFRRAQIKLQEAESAWLDGKSYDELHAWFHKYTLLVGDLLRMVADEVDDSRESSEAPTRGVRSS